MLTIRLPPEIENRLDALAKKQAGPRLFMPAKPSLNTWMTSKIYIWQSVSWKLYGRVNQRQPRYQK
jgi:predicted transcriptional regulator